MVDERRKSKPNFGSFLQKKRMSKGYIPQLGVGMEGNVDDVGNPLDRGFTSQRKFSKPGS